MRSRAFSYSEVGQLDVTFLRNHDVLRVDVTMNDPQGPAFVIRLEMGIAETPADSGDDEDG